MHGPFKGGGLFSYSPLALLELNAADFQTKPYGGLILPARVLWAEEPDVGLELRTP